MDLMPKGILKQYVYFHISQCGFSKYYWAGDAVFAVLDSMCICSLERLLGTGS